MIPYVSVTCWMLQEKQSPLPVKRLGMTLTGDRMLTLSIIKAIEIIGEAAVKITQETREKYPEIPWSQIVSMRNRLIFKSGDTILVFLYYSLLKSENQYGVPGFSLGFSLDLEEYGVPGFIGLVRVRDIKLLLPPGYINLY